jgi:hypothetical protein
MAPIFRGITSRLNFDSGPYTCLNLPAKCRRDVEIAVGAVRNHGLTRRKVELDAIEIYRNDIRFERGQIVDPANFSVGFAI